MTWLDANAGWVGPLVMLVGMVVTAVLHEYLMRIRKGYLDVLDEQIANREAELGMCGCPERRHHPECALHEESANGR